MLHVNKISNSNYRLSSSDHKMQKSGQKKNRLCTTMSYLPNYMLFMKSELGTFSKILFQVVGLLMFETTNVNFMVIVNQF